MKKMHMLNESITYIFLFIAMYFEIFLLITYFEANSVASSQQPASRNKKFPTVSVIVPVWNEETTVLKTIFSLLKLNYPKEKFHVFIVDDGSTDKTWNVLQRFNRNKQITLLQKENGGKHTALNYALQSVQTELVGCLDADSYVHPEALQRIVKYFDDKEIMAVTPSVKLFEPRGILPLLQKAEYIFGIFLRKVFAHLDAIYITPGPFSIFRRSVFDQIGVYKHAHNTEDMEIGMRMQRNNMRIGNAPDAFVYTVGPTTLYKLYKQRLRWVYGFLKNAIDYRDMFFKPQYGHLGMVILPAAGFSIVSTLYFFVNSVVSFFESAWNQIKQISTVGLSFPSFSFDSFYINTNIIMFISLAGLAGLFFMIITSRRMGEEKTKIGLDSILFILLYTLISPFWMMRAIYNVIFARKTSWR